MIGLVVANFIKYFCVATCPKLHGVAAACDLPGQAYRRTFVARSYNSLILAPLSRPMRDRSWILASAAVDYRAAKNRAALAPRDGTRCSSHEEENTGASALASPTEGSRLRHPAEITVRAPYFMAPAAIYADLRERRTVRKYSPRPRTDRRASCCDGAFGPDVFNVGFRENYRYMIAHPPPLPAPTPAVSEQGDSPGRPYNDWYSDWSGMVDYGGVNATADRPIDPKSESAESSQVQHIAATAPHPDPVTDGREDIPVSPVPNDAAPRPESRRSQNASAIDLQRDFGRLQEMSADGAPRTVCDRLTRREFANHLNPPPAIYNMMACGKSPIR